MDYQLLALMGVMVAVVVVGAKLKLWWWPGRPGYEYQRVIAIGAFGSFSLVAGLIGWRMSTHDAFVAHSRWAGGLIWWQVGLGVALLLLAGFWATRVPPRPTPR